MSLTLLDAEKKIEELNIETEMMWDLIQQFKHKNKSLKHKNKSFKHKNKSFKHKNKSLKHKNKSLKIKSKIN